MTIVVRPTGPADIPSVDKLCKELYNADPGASKLLETALLCLTAVHQEHDAIVGFLCLQDVPTTRFGSGAGSAAQDWLAAAPATQTKQSSTAYVTVFAAHPQLEEVPLALLRAALSTASFLQRFLLASGTELMLGEPSLAVLFTKVAANRDVGVMLYEATASTVTPPLAIRRAAVEDHDDMLPVLERAEARFPALAKLPESSRPEEAFALTRVVSGQNTENCVLVAHDESGAGKRLVGFMVLTSEVDPGVLLEAFDLHPYDNFLPEEEYERQSAEARESVRVKKTNTLFAKLGNRVRAKPTSRAAQADLGEGREGAGGEEGGYGDAGEPGPDVPGGPADDDEHIDITAAAEPTEEEVKAEMALLFGGGAADGGAPSTIFAVTMACIDEPYEANTLQFLRHAFDAFPDKTYCVLTLPHDSPEPPLVAPFTRLAPLPGANFPEVLYLINRHALMEDFQVRMAEAGDAEGVSMLVSGMPNSSDIIELFNAALERKTAVVATVEGGVVGLVTISPQVDVVLLEANFRLSDLVYLPHHPPSAHGEVDMLCINPIFAHRTRELLAGSQRLLGKAVLYYALPPGQPPPDMLEVLQQVPPRHRPVPDGLDGEFALYMFSRRNAFAVRRGVNARVVVVGASETGLAALERLLMDPACSFNYLTLLAPGGITVGGVACQYTASIISKLSLDSRVTLLDAEMVGLDREGRLIELSDGTQLPYDLLLVACGLQEQTCNAAAEEDLEVAGAVLNALELASDFSMGDAAAMSFIVTYGDSLEAYHALATLEARGASRHSAFYAPAGEADPLVSVLRECATVLQLDLPQPKAFTMASLHSIPGDPRPAARFEGPAGVEECQIDLLVGCQRHEASKVVFLCLNNSGIVYDGRVVVDTSFRTSDPAIYAAGSIARLSRQYGKDVLLEHYNSREVGTALGDAVAAAFTPAYLAGPSGAATRMALPLGMGPAKVVGCNVPGGTVFMYAGCPRAMASPSLVAPEGGHELRTRSDRGFMQVTLDAGGYVHNVAYLGLTPLPMHKLACLVGLHASYLNNLLSKFEAKSVPCLISFLTSDDSWASLIYHDGFAKLRHELLATSGMGVAAGEAVGSVLQGAQAAALEWVRSRASELPALHLPPVA